MGIRVPYHPLPIDQSDVEYEHGPDSSRQPDVPAGRTTGFDMSGSTAYPGTVPDGVGARPGGAG